MDTANLDIKSLS